ncbi:bifunctional enzyme CysN/CysC/sulfate adenylyltransferase subunit 1 [Saccharopolyspora erythraea NRRL 2338]|uniref:sulfate adenylyltransferase n=2 Tax=Saccharopolyspora erythraea TaxID=1836 RepID=A4FFI0_SACEN|nr:GTP-binding protein [Saccharopolyspora erythraea]EQD81370.1 sulfate adenylyltransferase [Saccharopolyspora erythraea D]PFG96526.1 bifunctional enzyme CysN/CysC/sulfate adenylyltransferase subunit 1 [Saccharopolyspora erythraea NRRL 2338]QRK93017.1 50S ribosome-binding GTPase [Saccharopolyspora erythraea]CAM02805.1 sulfate adenylyltransferase subunit 1 / adenylylsulfate kinase [Saccharopolyspora erythraea NRRL 2338]
MSTTTATSLPASGLLRFATAGAVDDGKSTLIGRLLHDSRSLLADQLDAVRQASLERGDEHLDLAMLTDGLRAEREQGITIDVAHRYFETARRAFIIADTPGHAQYTRNMVTGASTADLAIVLADARHGLTGQSHRHAVLAGLLRVRHVVLAVNKMDLVGYDRSVFDRIAADFGDRAERIGLGAVTAIPIAALHGDNVVDPSPAMPWYEGPTLLEHLETVATTTGDGAPLRLPVQYVIRAADGYTGCAGQLAAGVAVEGQEVLHLPSGTRTRIAALDSPDGPVRRAGAPLSVTVRLADDIDVRRGDLLCAVDSPPVAADRVDATVCWMSAGRPLEAGSRLLLKHTTKTVGATATAVHHRLDVTTLRREPADELALNDIGGVGLRLDEPVHCDPYARNRFTGGGVLIDESTNATVAAVMIDRASTVDEGAPRAAQ